MTYEVSPDGRADPVPGTESGEEPEPVAAVEFPAGMVSLEDMRAPWSYGDRAEDDR